MFKAMKRMLVDPKLIQLVKMQYKDTQFNVE
jgi:hypothetical protein